MKHTFVIVGLLVCVLGTACIPKHLQKYRRSSARRANTEPLATGPAADIQPGAKDTRKTKKRRAVNKSSRSATIYAVDEQTYRFKLDDRMVWDAVLNVLMRNYNLNIVNRESGIVTTEWDTYYLNNVVYRNKLSLRLSRINRGTTDVMIHNNVERLQQSAGSVSGVWLPAEGADTEVRRVVQNMAIVTNQPPPLLPTGNVAERDVPKYR